MTEEEKQKLWNKNKNTIVELLGYNVSILAIKGKISQYNDLVKVIDAIRYDNMGLIDSSGCAGVGIKYLKPYCEDEYLNSSGYKWRTICARHYMKELTKTFKYLKDVEDVHGYGGEK